MLDVLRDRRAQRSNAIVFPVLHGEPQCAGGLRPRVGGDLDQPGRIEAHPLQELFGGIAQDLGIHRELPVLLLAQPRFDVGIGHDVAPLVGVVDARTVQESTVHQHDGAAFGFDVHGGRQRTDLLAGFDGGHQSVAGWNHESAPVDLVDVLHDVDGVHEDRRPGRLDRVDGARVLMQVLRIAARTGDVRGERVRVVARAEKLVVELLEHRSALDPLRVELDAFRKAIALVHQGPHDVEVRRHVGEPALALGDRLLLEPVAHVAALALAHGIFDEAEAVLLQVVPRPVDVLRFVRQIVELLPVFVLTGNGGVVVRRAIQSAALGAPARLVQRTAESLGERAVRSCRPHPVAADRWVEPRVVLVHRLERLAGGEPLGIRQAVGVAGQGRDALGQELAGDHVNGAGRVVGHRLRTSALFNGCECSA